MGLTYLQCYCNILLTSLCSPEANRGGAAVESLEATPSVTVEHFAACRKHLMIFSSARILLKHTVIHRCLLEML